MNFDDEAKNWDNDPKKTERAIVFAKEIIDFINPDKTLNALEFGCGTGLLSFQLKDYFKTITLADNSEKMIKVLEKKIAKEGVENFKPLHIHSLESDLKINEYDVIYSLMTLHHIPDVNNIVNVFNSILKMGGYLCIADLVKEDGSFHSDHYNFDGHNGFDRNELSEILYQYGFDIEYYNICFEIVKEFDDKNKLYPLFLMICKKVN
jgi:2-polyprenyl-3-methyl-5-hydroxy-6-metoxy-1,4-benzoquinol methylase